VTFLIGRRIAATLEFFNKGSREAGYVAVQNALFLTGVTEITTAREARNYFTRPGRHPNCLETSVNDSLLMAATLGSIPQQCQLGS
jgi:hypothetical protein